MSLAQAREYASRHSGGAGVSGLVPLAETEPGQPMHPNFLAGEITAEFRLSATDVLEPLDKDDREAILTGSNLGRAEARRCAAKA